MNINPNNLCMKYDDLYKINNEGFGEEGVKIDGRRSIAMFGCSDVFCQSCADDETILHNINNYNVNNFGIVGASNDLITRNVLIQNSKATYDINVIFLTRIDRTEIINVKTIFNYLYPFSQFKSTTPSHITIELLKYEMLYGLNTAEKYYNLYKNILMLQYFFKSRGGYYIIDITDSFGVYTKNIEVKNLYDMIDKSFLYINNVEILDYARDKVHRGKNSNKIIADYVLSIIESKT